MNDWMFPKIVDYWDQRYSAIERLSRKIPLTSSPDYDITLQQIREAIKTHVDALSDEWLKQSAWIMCDDLYKAANAIDVCDGFLLDYLEASAGTFCSKLRQRGYVLHYLVDNEFEVSFLGLDRPCGLFKDWFKTSGIFYICPQAIAIDTMKMKGVPKQDHFTELPQFLPAARQVAEECVRVMEKGNGHYMLIDGDPSEKEWVGRHFVDSPGVINVYRNEPPVAGSKCLVKFPETRLNEQAK